MDRIVATVRRIIRSSAYAPLLRECAGFLASCGESEVLWCGIAGSGRRSGAIKLRSRIRRRPQDHAYGSGGRAGRAGSAERDLAPMSQLTGRPCGTSDPQAARWRHSVFWEVAHTRGLAHAAANTVSELRLSGWIAIA